MSLVHDNCPQAWPGETQDPANLWSSSGRRPPAHSEDHVWLDELSIFHYLCLCPGILFYWVSNIQNKTQIAQRGCFLFWIYQILRNLNKGHFWIYWEVRQLMFSFSGMLIFQCLRRDGPAIYCSSAFDWLTIVGVCPAGMAWSTAVWPNGGHFTSRTSLYSDVNENLAIGIKILSVF